MLHVKRIPMTDPLFQQVIDLRVRVLLGPVGWTYEQYKDELPGREERCEHFVAVVDHPEGARVVGTAMLDPASSVEDGRRLGKVLQVAVDPQMQGQGIGRRVMVAVEARAMREQEDGGLGLDGVYCHAQARAIGFYEQLGWSIQSETFLEAGIEHKRMGIPGPEKKMKWA